MLRYPRDPSLDPQLVWKGKDEQDGEDLVVPAVPIHIQEQISPKAIIEDLRGDERRPAASAQLDLFCGDFNGHGLRGAGRLLPPPDEVVEPDDPGRLAAGDDLAWPRRRASRARSRRSTWTRPTGSSSAATGRSRTRKRDVKDGKVEDATRQPEQVRAFRDTWELGIHSYLSYLRDRLVVARELLTESGSIFVQIGDENVHLVRSAAGRGVRARELRALRSRSGRRQAQTTDAPAGDR